MSPEQFAYWLQGFVELCPEQQPSQAQWNAIKDHLSTVFVKVTAPLGKPPQGTPPSIPPAWPDGQKLDTVWPRHINWPLSQLTVTC